MTKKTKKKVFISAKQNDFIIQQASKSNEQLLRDFSTSKNGLKHWQIETKRDEYGFNTINSKNKLTWYKVLFSSFITPFTIILLLISLLNILLPIFQKKDPSVSDWVTFGIILWMVFLSGILKFIQDFKSTKACEKLNQIINTTALIERDGLKKELPIQEILPGDIVHLAAGDMVPADLRLLYAKDLFITQSALTGESEPVEKTSVVLDNYSTTLDCNNVCFMGTTVASGSAYGVVIQTGKNTIFGKIAKIVSDKKPLSSFDKGIRKVSKIILITMSIMCLVIFLIKGLRNHFIPNGLLNNGWIDAFTFSLAAAIAIIPEMLPMIITLNLSKEAIKFSKEKAIIKNINSIQTFGAMNVLCTDKTGTLTEDHIILQEHLNVQGKEDKLVLLYGCLNSYHQTGLKNLIDNAIIERAKQKHIIEEIFEYTKVDEIPFDFERRRMSIILRDKKDVKKLITKGASEEILSICSKILLDGQVADLTKQWLTKIKEKIAILNENGMRVICVATNYKQLLKNEAFSDEDEKDLMLVGFIALLDPPKMSAKAAINNLRKKGVEVKILTGDNEKVTNYICKEIGINNPKILLGDQIANISFDELKEIVMDITIFAKLSPEQKALVVRALKANNNVVGYMGDGINDAPAMIEADIAISVDSAVDIAKESADVILLEKDLDILGHGCIQGRKTFTNIMKYIKISLSSNFGNMLSILIAACWLPFNPMQSIQIIFLNLFYDFAQLSIPWDSVDDQFLLSPKNWDAMSIIKFMVIFGPISAIFDIITFLFLFYYFGYSNNTNQNVALFNAGWFIESAISQLLIIYILRSKKCAFIQTNPSLPVVMSTSLSTIFLISTPFIPWVNYGLKFVNHLDNVPGLTPIYWLILLMIIVFYITLTEFVKKIYLKINKNEWI